MRATTARCFQTILADDPAKAAKALGEALRNAAIEQYKLALEKLKDPQAIWDLALLESQKDPEAAAQRLLTVKPARLSNAFMMFSQRQVHSMRNESERLLNIVDMIAT